MLTLLPASVQAEVLRYKLVQDQQRALVSRLLQRKCCAEVTSLEIADFDIKRTKGGKPFCACPCNKAVAPNFNFNVSHEVAQGPNAVFVSNHDAPHSTDL